MKTVVGIDLGTTYSLVAAFEDGRAVVLPNSVGEVLTPSVVSVAPDGRMLVGAAAHARSTLDPSATARAFKRDMGTSRIFELGPHKMTPPALSALILDSLRKDAEAALGRPVDEAVVTVPAYFGDLQRQATRAAAEIAGLKVERILNEPTAAALAYGLNERHREMRAVVLDLGGGTFDVTVLEIIEGVIEIQSSAGDARLGGEDFDEALASVLMARLGVDESADDPTRARIRAAAESAKKRLSDAETAAIALVELPVGRSLVAATATISRHDAEEAWGPLIGRMRGPIVRALRDAALVPERIDEVLLVGGSTRMPCVARLAAELFGKLPLRTLPPDEAVAMGAAVQAALKVGDAAVDDVVVTDVAPFTLGIETSSTFGTGRVDGLFSPILERGTVIPASRVRTFHTMHDQQSQIRVSAYQGEHSLCRDNQKLGECLIRNIPPAPAGEQPVDVRFTYDLNGILEVDTTVRETGKVTSLVIERAPGRLSTAEVSAARAALARLKFHPREALPNVTALARADALHVELAGAERALLEEAIARFRAALEAQHDLDIARERRRLAELTASLHRRS